MDGIACCYFVYDEENDTETLYSLDGNALLRVQSADWYEFYEMNGMAFLQILTDDGDYICYLIG